MRRISLAILFLLWGLTAINCKRNRPGPPPGPQGHFVVIKGDTLFVEMAITPGERARGLMFRERLAPDSGMLFVFPRTQRMSFWMKNTPLPLSIAFLDENWVVVDTQDMEPLSETPHISRAPGIYALEAPGGWFRDRGIGPGDTARFR